jgi:hypothetical protein
MNYIQLLKDSYRYLRENKLIWIFVFLSSLETTVFRLPRTSNAILSCAYLIVHIAVLVVNTIANIGLIYIIYQFTLFSKPNFSEAWSIGKSKFFRTLVFVIPAGIILLIIIGIKRATSGIASSSPFPWLIDLFLGSFSACITFGYCAIVIHDTKAFPSVWSSLLITLNNFFRILVITGGVYIIHLLVTGITVAILVTGPFKVVLPTPLNLDYPTYQKISVLPLFIWENWILNLFLFPMETIMLTLGYLKFTKEISYPGLSPKQTKG